MRSRPLGLGTIGGLVAVMATSSDMVIAHDPHDAAGHAAALSVKLVALDKLMRRVDSPSCTAR